MRRAADAGLDGQVLRKMAELHCPQRQPTVREDSRGGRPFDQQVHDGR